MGELVIYLTSQNHIILVSVRMRSWIVLLAGSVLLSLACGRPNNHIGKVDLEEEEEELILEEHDERERSEIEEHEERERELIGLLEEEAYMEEMEAEEEELEEEEEALEDINDNGRHWLDTILEGVILTQEAN